MRLLLVEDDPKLGALLGRVLSDNGYEVTLARDVAAARAVAQGVAFDLAVVDWMLPDGSGVELCGFLRSRGLDAPVLMLTARGETKDRVQALDGGADDYLTKPFEIDELLARLRALARRGARSNVIELGPFHVDLTRRNAFLRGRLLALTSRELDLLACLAGRGGSPVSKQELVEMWEAAEAGGNVVEVHVSRLRDKLGGDAGLVETVRGVGYRINVDKQRP